MRLRQKLTGVVTAIACMGLLSVGVTADFSQFQDGIHIGGIDVSGMTYEQAMSVLNEKVQNLQNAKIVVNIGEDQVETTAADLGLQWKNRGIVKEALQLGNSGNIVSRFKQKKDLLANKKDYEMEMNANESIIKGFIAEECMQYESDPVESSISADGSGGIDLTVGEDGLKINVEESVNILTDYLEHNVDEEGGTVSLSVAVDAVASKEDIESIKDVLGTFTTYYGSTYGRDVNVERGAELLNGHLIKPGESFSVCDHLVPFNAENGYELGGAYENGRVVQEYGGGICQVSTTLYNALLFAEIEINERHNHTMSVSYVPTSMDAAIAEGTFDLVFTNNYDTPIFLSGYAYGGELTFTIWGKDNRPSDRYVYYESETTSQLEPPTNTVLFPAEDQPAGYFSQVQFAQAGSTAVLYKYVTYQGETTVDVVNESTYEPTPNAFEVGTMGANDTLLNAIYNDDVATAQLAATGVITVGAQGGAATPLQPILDPIRNIYVDPMTGQPIDGQVYGGQTYGATQDVYYGDTGMEDTFYYDNSTVY